MNVESLNDCSKDKPIVIIAHNPASTKPILEYANKAVKKVDLIISGNFIKSF